VDGVLHAFMHPEPVQYRDAWPGTARRMLDRLIGSTYGERDITGVDLSVGRVQSALLGAAAKEKIPYGEATIALPCCDRKEPFVATIPVYEHNLKAVQELIALAKEFEAAGQCVPFGRATPLEPFKPWTFGEAVLAISKATDRPIDDVSQSMQRLYEAGRMSYPRSDASAVTPQGIAALQKMAEQHGVRFDPSRVSTFSRNGRHAHESPRPLNGDVNITFPLLVLSKDEAALSLISRHLISCGQPHAVHSPDASALPAWAKNLPFERKVCQWMRPWSKKTIQTGLHIFPKEEIALSLLLKNKLGRSSTVVFHALKFASRGLLDEHARIDDKGADWIRRTPDLLKDPRTSLQIENILSACADESKQGEAPGQLVKSLLESMNMWGDVQDMLQKVEASQPQASSGLSG
jgi:DNA topoisomerase-1